MSFSTCVIFKADSVQSGLALVRVHAFSFLALSAFGHWRMKLWTDDVYFFPFPLVWSSQQASHKL